MKFLLSRKLQRLTRLYHLIIAKELPGFISENFGELILILYSFDKPLTNKDLTIHLQLDKSRVAVLTDQLTQLGYIFIQVNPDDRREHFVHLTEKGKQAAPIIQQAIKKVDGVLHGQLEQQQVISFYKTLQQMEHNLADCFNGR
jgi:DNA-binding MarR family transcriptional regulator